MTSTAATVACLLAASAVGGSIAVTPFIADYPVLAGQAARYGLAAAVLLALLRWREDRRARARGRLSVRQVGRLVVAAATGSAGFNVLLVAASREADPAALGAVVGASPVVLAVLGAPLRSGLPRPRPAVVAGAALAAGGVVVLHGTGVSTPLGLLLAVAVLACEVAFTLVAAPLLPALGALRVSALSCAAAAVMLAAAAAVAPGRPRLPTPTEAGTLAYQALVMTALAFVLWYAGVARLGPDRAGVTMAAAPLAAAFVAALVGTGTLGVATGIGAALVGGGVALSAARGRSPRRDHARRARQPQAPRARGA